MHLLRTFRYASSNKCHASSNKCLTSSNKKLLVKVGWRPSLRKEQGRYERGSWPSLLGAMFATSFSRHRYTRSKEAIRVEAIASRCGELETSGPMGWDDGSS